MQSQILRCVLLGVGIIVGLTACQSTPVPQKVMPHTPPTPTKPSITTSDGVKITTYDYPQMSYFHFRECNFQCCHCL